MSRREMNAPEIAVSNDGLYTPEVGDWAERKYRLLWHYANLFATSMKHKWDQRVFIDLFSGAGFASIRGTERVVQTSSLLALQVADPFDCYVFCDSDVRCIEALKKRVERVNPQAKCFFENCNVNKSCSDVIGDLPLHGPQRKVLSFCFIDPFGLTDIRFETIKSLSSRFVDFLIHVPAMDPIRNEGIYYPMESERRFRLPWHRQLEGAPCIWGSFGTVRRFHHEEPRFSNESPRLQPWRDLRERYDSLYQTRTCN